MVIITVQVTKILVRNVRNSFGLVFSPTGCLFLLALMPLKSAATVEFKPKLDVTFLHILEADISANDYAGHEVATVNPSFQLQRTGRLWSSTVNAEHNQINQLHSGYDDTSYNNIDITNRFAFLDDKIVFSNSISRANRNIDTSLGANADPIFGQAEFIDVDSISNKLVFKNGGRSAWQNELSLTQSKTSFDETKLTETDSDVTNLNAGDSQSASLKINYGQRPSQLRGGVQIAFSRNTRGERGDQDSLNGGLSLGVPIVSDFDFVVQAVKSTSKIENSVLVDSDLGSESYGAGIAWRFGSRSNIEVTYNKETRGQEDTFVGYKLEFYPSERTSLNYEQSRRFYGESHSFSFAHAAKRWGASINYAESLGSQTRIAREEVLLGSFICPFGGVLPDSCEEYAGEPEDIPDGFAPVDLVRPVFSLEEEVILSKSISASVNYKFKKSSIALSYSEGESEYLEREESSDSTRKTESFSFKYNHEMTRRNSLSINATSSKSRSNNAASGDRDRSNASINFTRKTSRNADVTISLIKINSESTTGRLDRNDTRFKVSYSYRF